MKSIVILGGSGYIGTHLAEQWLKQDNDVNITSLSRNKPKKLSGYLFENSHVQWLAVNALDPDSYITQLPKHVDVIINLIGGSKKNSDAEFYRLNVEPVNVMIKLMNQLSIPKGCYISAVRGLPGKAGRSFTRSKRKAEAITKTSGKNIAILRPSFVYGDRAKVNGVVGLLKVIGFFNKNMKPMTIDTLIDKIIESVS